MLPSQTVENYLKTIYLAQARQSSPQELVPVGHLAAALGVVPGTATTMVKALSESGLVHYEPYMGVRLTPAGEKLYARSRPTFNAGQQKILDVLRPAERDMLLDLLVRVVEGNRILARPGAGRRKRSASSTK